MNIGDTFLLPTPPQGNHLFFVIATTADGNYLCVNATSLRPSSDTACILKAGLGVPNFVVRDSAIAYKYAREISPAVYSGLVSNGQCIAKGSCSASILDQIQKGALASKQIAKKHKQTVKKFLGLP